MFYTEWKQSSLGGTVTGEMNTIVFLQTLFCEHFKRLESSDVFPSSLDTPAISAWYLENLLNLSKSFLYFKMMWLRASRQENSKSTMSLLSFILCESYLIILCWFYMSLLSSAAATSHPFHFPFQPINQH